jgi:hypothetical protein
MSLLKKIFFPHGTRKQQARKAAKFVNRPYELYNASGNHISYAPTLKAAFKLAQEVADYSGVPVFVETQGDPAERRFMPRKMK